MVYTQSTPRRGIRRKWRCIYRQRQAKEVACRGAPGVRPKCARYSAMYTYIATGGVEA